MSALPVSAFESFFPRNRRTLYVGATVVVALVLGSAALENGHRFDLITALCEMSSYLDSQKDRP
jgi:hypothetical protein